MARFVELAERAADELARRFGKAPRIGIVLGSGLQVFGRRRESLPYREIPGFPIPKSGHHRGMAHLVERWGKSLFVLEGRAHLYDGYDAMEATLPLAALAVWGVEKVVLSGVCGAVGRGWSPGQWVEIRDCLNLSGDSPNWPCLGKAGAGEEWCAADSPRKVTAVGILGPSLPTAAEWAMFRTLGADVVSMSTGPERSACAQLGLSFSCIYLITDIWDGRRYQGSVAEARRIAQQESHWLWNVYLRDLG